MWSAPLNQSSGGCSWVCHPEIPMAHTMFKRLPKQPHNINMRFATPLAAVSVGM